MNRRISKIRKFLLITLILVILLIVVKVIAINKIETLLSKNTPQQLNISYSDIHLNLFTRSLTIDQPKIQFKSLEEKTIQGRINFEEIKIENFGLIDYLRNDEIGVNTILIDSPEGYIYEDFRITDSLVKSNNSGENFGALTLKNLIIKNANIALLDRTRDSLKFKCSNFNLKLNNIDVKQQLNQLDFDLNDYTVKSDSIFLKLDDYNNVVIGQTLGNIKKNDFINVKLKTKYSPNELSHHINVERDYYDLSIDTISSKHIKIDPKELSVGLTSLTIIEPKLSVYRDKLIADDFSTKPMLNEIIMRIPIAFKIDDFNIKNAYVNYKERVHAYNQGGEMFFDTSNIHIQNLTNMDSINQMQVNIDALFFGKSPIKATWSFNPHNPQCDFAFVAEIEALNLNEINSYSKPNLNTTMTGHINKLYYTISGNKSHSTIDLKAQYSDIKISVLNKTHNQRNKFYSSIANLVISSSSKNKKSPYKTAQTTVKRDVTKSNINFIYENIKAGLTKILL